MEFRLLGPLEVVDGATSLPIAARKQRALLAVLLLNASRTVSRERIVDDLWGDTVPDSARKLVQTYVSQLRKVLPEPRLHTRSPGYALELEEDELDLDRFERLVADGRAALSGGRPGDAADVIQSALALWRGPALAEFSEPFARHEASRLEELRLTALEWRIEADLAVGRDADVVGELEALVPRHPLRERFRSQQMLALYRAGRPAEALASYESFRRTLADELGNEPSPALKDLERRIVVQDPRLERPSTGPEAVAPPAVLPVAPRASRTVLVGREAELAGVREFLSAGTPTALVLVGGPGIGKTSLWEAGVDAAREHGLRVLAARPTDAEAQHSFATLIDLLDGIASNELGSLPVPSCTRSRSRCSARCRRVRRPRGRRSRSAFSAPCARSPPGSPSSSRSTTSSGSIALLPTRWRTRRAGSRASQSASSSRRVQRDSRSSRRHSGRAGSRGSSWSR